MGKDVSIEDWHNGTKRFQNVLSDLNGVNLNEPSNLSFSILVSFCSLLTLSTEWNKSSKINEVFKFPLELDKRILY